MKDKTLVNIVFVVFIVLQSVFLGMVIGRTLIENSYKQEIQQLQEQNDTLEIENEQFKNYIQVLEQRLEDSKFTEEEKEQMVDDFELVIELQQYYYQENITSHSFGDWLQINYPELYRRIESYF